MNNHNTKILLEATNCWRRAPALWSLTSQPRLRRQRKPPAGVHHRPPPEQPAQPGAQKPPDPIQTGFSLIELSIVLMVVAIAFGSITRAGMHWGKQRQLHERRTLLETSRQALLAYTLRHGHLPCPAPDEAGSARLEARNRQSCRNHTGLIPNATLGLRLPPGTRLHYTVSPEFANDAGRSPGSWPCTRAMQFASFNLCDQGRQRIYAAQPLITRNLIADDIVAVVLDPGTPASPRGTEESENLDGNRAFVRAGRTQNFDDEIVWISANTIKYQLARVGMMY